MELMVCELEGRATVRVFPCLVGVRDLCPGGSADYFFWHCSGVQAEERD